MDADFIKAENLTLETALASLQSTATTFGANCIRDAAVRAQYMRDIQAAVEEIAGAVRQKSLTPIQGAERANQLRNEIMELSRLRSSSIGRAYAMKMKRTGKTLAELTEHYSQKLFKKSFAMLDESRQATVYLEIVNAAGRSNGTESAKAKYVGKIGQRLFLVSLGVAVYEIFEAEDKPREVARQGTLVAAGFTGGLVAGSGVVAGGICAATAPVCIAISALLGAILFSSGADLAFGTVYPRPAGR